MEVEINKIYNVDCLELMMRMSPHMVDLILTSPPYSTSRNGKGPRAFENYENRYDVYLDNKTDEEYLDWTETLFGGFNKILKPNGCVLYNISYSSENTDLIWKVVSEIIYKTHFTTADCIIWKKKNALPNNVSPNKLTRIVEYVFVFARKQELGTFYMNKNIVGELKTGQVLYENKLNFFEADNNDGSNDLNKATFSTGMARRLIQMYAKPGAVVYDSFTGTGTCAEAAVMEKCSYLGSEISEAQCRYAEKRLGIRIAQPELF